VFASTVHGQDLQIAGKIAFHALQDGNREIFVMNADGSGVVRLTSNTADDVVPSWSPDGTRIAFSSVRDGNCEIYVMNADGSGLVRLTTDPALDNYPSWSPDGTRLAFVSSGSGLHVMNADGSANISLGTGAESCAWSPDGTRIAYNVIGSGLYTIKPDGTSSLRLNSAYLNAGLAYSPDGARIAYVTGGGGGLDDIHVVDADGTDDVLVAGSSVGLRKWTPSWSPDGSRIAFGLGDANHNFDIYTMAATGGSLARLTTAPSNQYIWPSWQSFRYIGQAVVGSTVARTMMVTNAGSATLNVTQITATDPTFSVNPSAFSLAPGGSQAVVVEFRPVASGTVYTTLTLASNDLDSPLTRLVVNGRAIEGPPDLQIANQIAFESDRDGNREIYAMNPDGTGQTNLTQHPSSDQNPAWSPDGSRIAFTSARDNPSGDIYLMDANGAGVTRVTTNSGVVHSADYPFSWSPDGTKIAFASTRDGQMEIYTADTSSGTLTRLTSNAAEDGMPSWSPDGTMIVFKSSRDHSYGEIYLMNSDGSNVVRLTSDGLVDSDPAWSPDGTRIAFRSGLGGSNPIYSMNVGGSGRVQLTPAVDCHAPSWSPDGTRITYDAWQIYTVTATGGTPSTLTSGGTNVTPSWAPFRHIGQTTVGTTVSRTMVLRNTGTGTLSVSSITLGDGQFSASPSNFSVPPGSSQDVAIAFSPASAGTKYATLTITSNDPDSPSIQLTVNGTGRTVLPPVAVVSALSPADTRIAFASERDEAGGGEIYSMLPDGTGVTRLTNSPGIDNQPAWSPNGARLAFKSTRDGDTEIYTMQADGSGVVRLTTSSGNDDWPAWSPDGTRIAFHSGRGGSEDIYTMRVDGSDITRLTSNAAVDICPTWSPDRTRIAFQSNRDGNWELYLISVDGSTETRLTSNSADDGNPTFTPDGRLSFTSTRDGNSELYIMNLDGSGLTRLTNTAAFEGYHAWSPDASKVTFTTNRDENTEVYVMNADGSSPTRLTNNSVSDEVRSWSALSGLDFGYVTKDSMAFSIFRVTNHGQEPLTVSSISSTNPQFSVAPSSFTLSGAATQTVTVTFSPTSAGAKAGTLTILSNDPMSPSQTVSLSGNGTDPPPGAPQGLSSSAGNGQVVLSWTAAPDADLSHYVLYRTQTAG
ncbi:MAG: choice-of-anchor D domain-containing protein, partial [Candidatus Latescibacterota bacterium]